MALTYFAADGNYGDAAGLHVIDTSAWTEEDWEVIELARDDERLAVATSLDMDPDQLELDFSDRVG